MKTTDMEVKEPEEGEISSSEQCGGGETDDICVGRSTQNNLQENDEIILSSLLHKDGHDETILLQFSERSQDLLIIASFTIVCLSLVAWLFFRHVKHQKEWQRASNLKLEQIAQRNIHTNLPPKEEQTTKTGTTQSSTASNSSTGSCKEMDKDRVRSIRAQQQRQNEIKAKLAKQQKQLAKKEKQRQIYESLHHEDADEAYQRRTQVIREEQAMLQAANKEHSIRNEAEEIERRELLRMQNLEYEESLRRDQERLVQANIELERCQMRVRALQDAIHRLERAGIYTAELPIIDHKTKTQVEIRDEDKVQVRLMMPSGKRVQATYSKCHTIGLLYDLALVILNYDQDKYADFSTQEELRASTHSEWRELFDPFTIQTIFPPQRFEDMDLTLEECGLEQSITLMIIVESD